ncbi:O-antigen ligase family protein [Desulfobacula sp.]|uniref:O-antigen ligase family protein n=1 Tax=Desulfobacula sp. TaxID=2593537 RepID=UPI0025BC3B4E|nr:O-antigen ligase family protein [Desulfobacula sp.]
METGTGLACLLFFISILKNNNKLYQVPGITPLLLFLFYILFQLIPLPPFIIEYLSPETFKIHQITNLLADTNSWMSISVHQKATLSEFFRYATYVMFYVLTIQLLKEKEMLQTTVLVIVFFGGLLAFSSILQFYLTEDMALWFRHSPINSIVVGPYANHNHYAGLMELIFPVVLGLFLFYRPRIGNTSLIKGIAQIFSQEKANIHILIGASALLIVISIFVSLSRGAMISTCFSLLLFTFFLLKRKISKGNTLLMIGLIIITTLSIGWFGWDQIFERFAKLKNAQGIIYQSRLDFWKDTQGIISHHTITGSGMGTFSHIYPLHRSFKRQGFLTHAHNDYLELLAEGGIIAFLLAASFLLTLFYKTYKTFSKRRDAFSIYLYIGCITAMVSILLHSFTDFNMHIGANGLWFFFIAGIAVSAANTGLRKQSKETRLAPVNALSKKLSSAFIVCSVAVLLMLYNISNLLGVFYYSNIKNYTMSVKTPPDIIKKIEKVAGFASQFDPFHAAYSFTQANTAWFLNDLERSRTHFIDSLRLDPLNSRHLNRFASFLAQQGEPAKGHAAFKNSMVYDKSNAEYTFQYGTWLLAQKDFKQGFEYMKKTLALNEKYFERVLTSMIVSGVNDSDMEQAIPNLPGPTIEYANFLSNTGSMEDAVIKYLAALDLIETLHNKTIFTHKDPLVKIRFFYYKIFKFFRTRNDLKNAMGVMEKAERTLPMDARIKITLGDLYYSQGILYKAFDKYDHALLLEPGNKKALKMIQKLNQ